MFKAIFDNLRFLFTFVEEIRRLRSEQKELRQAVEDMEKGYFVLSGAVREMPRTFRTSKKVSSTNARSYFSVLRTNC